MAATPCARCASPNAPNDRYCGACGTALADLRWRSSGDRFHEGEGHLVVRASVPTAVARLVNRGVGAAAVVLREPVGSPLPAWIDAARLPRSAFALAPGEEATVSVGLNLAVLQAMFGQTSTEARRTETADAELHFRTTLTHGVGEDRAPVELTLRVLLARDPWITPAASHYPFVSWEHLAGSGVSHPIEFHNEAAETIRLQRVEVTNSPLMLGRPEQRIDAAAVLRADPRALPLPITPGDCNEVALRLAGTPEPSKSAASGWFSATVSFHYSAGTNADRPDEASATIDGFIGRAPGLVFEDGATRRALPLSAPPEKPVEIVLTNPGAIPVTVRAAEVLQEVDGVLTPVRPDWLLVQGADRDFSLPAGGVVRLNLTVRPELRSDEETLRDVCTRVIRLRHDGWAADGEFLAELKFEVKFPPTMQNNDIWLGVDFGTSSSMVCVIRDAESAALILEPELGSEQLASLMYFSSSRKGPGADDNFLLGAAAKNSASINPANLVRSIKSVIARAPDTVFHFEPANPADGFQRYTTQQLLDHFIRALRVRGESGVHRLSTASRRDLFENAQNVRFRRAVFTHPVEVSETMKRALHGAARAAKLENDGSTADQFITSSCIDEATAAVLAYVFLRAYQKLKGEFPALDVERILCLDIGGGTTDVAAVEVAGLSTLESSSDPVTVTLHATAGNRFGGDDLDRYLAAKLLAQVFKVGEGPAALAALADYENALDARSLDDFKAIFRSSSSGDAAYGIYRKVSELRTRAEEAKRRLGTEKAVEVTIEAAGWPNRKAGPNEKEGDKLKLTLTREEFVAHVKAETLSRSSLLDQAVANAGWGWSDVTTLLFTGQGTRVPAIRETVQAYVGRLRGAAGPLPIVVQPDDGSGFDPKRCVALGAAVWGSSAASGWISVQNRMSETLTFDLQRRSGPRMLSIIAAGTPLPAEAEVRFNTPTTQLDVYKGGVPFVRFSWPVPATSVQIQVRGLAGYWVVANDQSHLGVFL